MNTSWWHLKNILRTLLEDVMINSWSSFEREWLRRIYLFWSTHLEDVFWRRMTKGDILVLINTSRRRQKMSSWCLHQYKCLLGCYIPVSSENTRKPFVSKGTLGEFCHVILISFWRILPFHPNFFMVNFEHIQKNIQYNNLSFLWTIS